MKKDAKYTVHLECESINFYLFIFNFIKCLIKYILKYSQFNKHGSSENHILIIVPYITGNFN